MRTSGHSALLPLSLGRKGNQNARLYFHVVSPVPGWARTSHGLEKAKAQFPDVPKELVRSAQYGCLVSHDAPTLVIPPISSPLRRKRRGAAPSKATTKWLQPHSRALVLCAAAALGLWWQGRPWPDARLSSCVADEHSTQTAWAQSPI